MSIFDALILSLVEGLSEFLPVSSTGHLILVSKILAIEDSEFLKSFVVIIQLGAIMAVVLLYWRKILGSKGLWKNLLTSFIPTAVVGLVLYKIIKNLLLGNTMVVVVALFIGGLIMIWFEKTHQESKASTGEVSDLSIKQSFLIGCCQSLSVIPGISRSAASILGAMWLGVKRQAAVEFSFMLAIPTMIASIALDMVKNSFGFNLEEWLVLAVGLVGSFIFALLAVKYFLNFIQKNSLVAFGVYRIIIALLFWLFVR